MQYGVGREVKVRRQEVIKEVQCFRCRETGHYKWKYPNIEVEKKRRRRGSMPYKGKSAATRESKKTGAGMFQLGKGTGILQSGEHARGCTVVRVRIDDRRGHSDLHRMQMVWKERDISGGQQGARSSWREKAKGS